MTEASTEMNTQTNADVSTQTANIAEKEKSNVNLVYILQALGFVVGVTFAAAIIMNFLRKTEANAGSEFYRTHNSYQLRTGLWSLLWSVIGFATSLILVGYVVLLINFFWTLYRVIRGFMAANDGKAI